MSLRLLGCVTLLCLCLPFLSPVSAKTLPRHSVLGAAITEDAKGPSIQSVIEGSPAQRAHLEAGDVIASIAGAHVADRDAVVDAVRRQPSGVPIVFSIIRKTASLSVPVTLDTAPNEDDPLVVTAYDSVPVDGTLRRTLVTYPRQAKASRHPAVLIIGGIGCYSVDVARNPQDAYLRIAHDLGRRGIVVMRLEKSGIGDSEGPPCAIVDFVSEEHSYEVALAALERDRHVDPKHVYLFGHSIGSGIAPQIAAKTAVAGVMVADGFGVNWFEYELINLRRQLDLAGEAPDKVDIEMADKEICMHKLLIEKLDEVAIEKEKPACKDSNTYPKPAAYLQQVAALNVGSLWKSLSVPVLAIYGTADFVTSRSDHERIIQIVNAGHAGAGTFLAIDGMDHYLTPGGTQQQDFDLRVKKGGTAPYDPRFSGALASWLCARAQCLPEPSNITAGAG